MNVNNSNYKVITIVGIVAGFLGGLIIMGLILLLLSNTKTESDENKNAKTNNVEVVQPNTVSTEKTGTAVTQNPQNTQAASKPIQVTGGNTENSSTENMSTTQTVRAAEKKIEEMEKRKKTSKERFINSCVINENFVYDSGSGYIVCTSLESGKVFHLDYDLTSAQYLEEGETYKIWFKEIAEQQYYLTGFKGL